MVDEVWDRFLSALRPLRRTGKLGALLFQLPPWFVLKHANKDHLYVIVDMPQKLKGSIPTVTVVTSDELAVVRFHGRNRQGFEERSFQGLIEYRYTRPQLKAWVPKLRALSRQAETVHVVFRNAYADYAVRNAAELQRLLAAG